MNTSGVPSSVQTSAENISLEMLYDSLHPGTIEWILISAYLIIFAIGVAGNILVCFVVWKNKDMRTVTNIFMLNLSVADLVILVFCLPSVLIVDVTLTWFLGVEFCKIYVFLTTCCVSVSVMTLTVISVERWYAICHPLRFRSTFRRAKVIIVVIWVTSSFIALPELITSTVVPFREDTVLLSACYPALWDDRYTVIWQICLMTGLYFLPIALMAFAYTHIAIVLWRGSLIGASDSCRNPVLQRTSRVHENEEQIESRKKAAKMLIAIVVVFALCFLPNHTLNILRYSGQLHAVEYKRLFALFAHWAAFFNSCINPVIYNFMSEKFRRAFEVSLKTYFGCARSVVRQNSRQPSTYNVVYRSGLPQQE